MFTDSVFTSFNFVAVNTLKQNTKSELIKPKMMTRHTKQMKIKTFIYFYLNKGISAANNNFRNEKKITINVTQL